MYSAGTLRDGRAILTEARADQHPRAPAEQPPLKASRVLGRARPLLPTPCDPKHEVVSAHGGLGAVGKVSHESLDPPFSPQFIP